MSALFISHSSKDDTIAEEIKKKLEENGHRSTFLDFDPEKGITAGQNWEKELYTKLRSCQAVIVLCSKHSTASRWCFAEITQARSLGKHIFPLKISACKIDYLLGDIQVIDFTLNKAEGYQRLWKGLKSIGLDPTNQFDWDSTRPPYPGLLAFQEQDAAIYFGREATVQNVIETFYRLQRLGSSRMALILGASGSGKSSLVRAGVIPRLKRDIKHWLVLEPFRPGVKPFDKLAMVLAGAFSHFGVKHDWKFIREELQQDTGNISIDHLLDMANDLRSLAGQYEATILLVIDQFEELLGKTIGESSANNFLRFLRAVSSESNCPFLIVATLRSDFLSEYQLHEATQNLVYEPIPIQQMALADFVQAIEGPAKVAEIELEPGLVQAMITDTATNNALPLLAFTLRELWDRAGNDGNLTLDEYKNQIGGLHGSVARVAEEIYFSLHLSTDDELTLQKAFLSMVRIDENRFVRKTVRWDALPQNVINILERFVQARLLVSHSENSDRILEVAHETLFHSWNRFDTWLKVNRDFLLWRQKLSDDLEKWKHTDYHDSALLRGPMLVEAEYWLKKQEESLDSIEKRYIQASQNHEIKTIQHLENLVREAEKQKLLAQEQAYISQSNELALRSISLIDEAFDRALLLSAAALNLSPTFSAKSALYRAINAYPNLEIFVRGHFTTLPPGAKARLTKAVAFHPTSMILAAIGGYESRSVMLWEWKNGRPIGEPLVGLESRGIGVQFNCDGRYLAAADDEGNIVVWEIADQRKIIHKLSTSIKCTSFAFHPSGQIMAMVNHCNEVQLGNLQTNQPLCNPLQYKAFDVTFTPDGQTLAIAGQEKIILCTILEDKITEIKEILVKELEDDQNGGLSAITFNPSGSTLASMTDRAIYLWDTESGTQIGEPLSHEGMDALSFSHNGCLLASAEDKGIIIRDFTASKNLRFDYPSFYFDSIAFSPNGNQIALYHADDAITLWSIDKPRSLGEEIGSVENDGSLLLYTLDKPNNNPEDSFESALLDHLLYYTPNGLILVISLSRQGISITGFERFEKGVPLLFTTGMDINVNHSGDLGYWHSSNIVSIAGSWLAAISFDHLHLFKLSSYVEQVVSAEFGKVTAIAFATHETVIAVGNVLGEIFLYDIASDTIREASLKNHIAEISALKFSGDGRMLVSVDVNNNICLWDATKNQLITSSFPAVPEYVSNFSFSDVDSLLAIGGCEGFAIYSTVDGSLVKSYGTGSSMGASIIVCYSPDGGILATSNLGKACVNLWNNKGSERLGPPLSINRDEVPISGAPIYSLNFSPDGKSLITIQLNHIVRWDLDPQSWQRKAYMIANRELTVDELQQYLSNRPYNSLTTKNQN